MDERACFRREILLARKVLHPNVCRVFDLGLHPHQVAADRQETIAFLTMELLAGEPLSRRLQRGCLPPAEALPLILEVAAGLHAAHQANIVHRDLKSDNIFLVPGPAGKVRAVITDFGLARSSAAGLGGEGGRAAAARGNAAQQGGR